MRKKRFSALAVVLSVVLTLVISLGGVALAAWLTIGTQGLTLLEGLALINTRFVGEYEKDGVTDAAMSGMVAGLNDRWSYYLNPESYAANQERRQNQYVGIGVTVSYEDERGLLVTIVNEGGPAEKAGLQAGDIIISAEGTSLAGEARYEGVNLIQGEAGTPVSLGIMAADGTERTVEVAREKLETNPVEYEMLDGNVGYIQVKNFYRRSADGVKAAVDELVGQGAVSLVFDMRNNGGGYLDELTEMLDYLLPEGPIFRSRDRAGNEQVTNSDAHCIDLPMATLVNKSTYSAAEFFGAELQEWGVGVIVGEETTGKGYSQQTYPLPGGGGLGISTGAYFTGQGTSLIGTGVTLDQECVLTDEENALLKAGKLPRGDDAPLQAAIKLLEEKKRPE
ncbi:S41 family peptidase [Pseudoflavonifractor phocaeensis]|uniref:S41 family peptidase n=1 Tax=Pseudoflavonifractor phocaeensis TaxID=1870988 RepID=UPI00210CA621|nr:S41 family peptidase [Pseudoflavonifractor phocaeensis]MCQ4865737.1 S41 family peptidase [Pseudoflavonifractor phocaeensis]